MKILLIRFSSIGDIVLTTPVIRCLKIQLKDAMVHFITKPQFKEVLNGNPYLDKLFTLKENLMHTIKELRQEKYDFIIDLHHNQRTFLIKRALNANSRSFHKMNLEKWLMVNFKVDRLKPVHIVDRYLETVRTLGVKNDGKGLDYFIPEKEKVDLDELPSAHRKGYFGWVIGAVHNTKKFPIHKIIEVCKAVEKPVILLGGKNEFETGEEISNAVGNRIYNTCGKFSLNQSASLVQQASAIVTNDTGLMHIAAAFKKPTISLWGNTIPEFGMTPYYGNANVNSDILEVRGLNCRPCSKLGYRECPKKHFKCMEAIEVNRIVELLNSSYL